MILESIIEKDIININSSKFPSVTGPLEVEYKIKFKILLPIIKVLTSCQKLGVQNQVS